MIGDAWMSEHLIKYIGRINHNSSIIQITKKDNSSVITFYNFLNMRIMSNGMPVEGIVYLTIEKNDNIDAQKVVFETVCKFLGIMDNNLPDEEIHHDVDNVYYYDQSKVHWANFGSMCHVMFELDIKLKLSKKEK